MSDPRLRRQVERLADDLTRMQQEVQTLRRAARRPQLGDSSIDSGALEVRDPGSGATRMRIGWIDGAAGVITEGGEPVQSPTLPGVAPSLGGLRVTWDGRLADDLALPADFDHMAVHVSTESGFEPSADTYVGSIRRAGDGGMLPVVPLPYEEHYVRLVPVTTGGIQGVPSAQVAATPLRVDAPDLSAGSIEAVHIAAGAVEADKLAAIITLTSRLIAGTDGAARVELNGSGIQVFNTDNQLVTALNAVDGSALLTGTAQSAQFENNPETGIQGWRMSADGSVEIRYLTVGNDLYSIDPDGNAGFQSISADTAYINGEDLSAWVDGLPRGVIQLINLTGFREAVPGDRVEVFSGVIPEVEDRMYELILDQFKWDRGTALNSWMRIDIYSKYGGPATADDTLLMRYQHGGGATNPSDSHFTVSHVFKPPEGEAGKDLHYTAYITASATGSALELDTRSRVVVKDLGAAIDYETRDIGDGGGGGGTTTYTTTYDPTWSATWNQWGKRTENHAWQGNPGGTGNLYSKWGFPTKIQTDLSGARIDKIELYLRNEHFWNASGGQAIIGTHNNGSEPGGTSSTDGNFDRSRINFNRGQAKWVTLPAAFGTALAGSARGITIGSPSVGGTANYGYFRRYGSGSPRLRITYTK